MTYQLPIEFKDEFTTLYVDYFYKNPDKPIGNPYRIKFYDFLKKYAEIIEIHKY